MYTIYGKSNCGQCDEAKRWANREGIKYEYIDITEDIEKYQWVLDTAKTRTMPIIMVGESFIGSTNEFKTHATIEFF